MREAQWRRGGAMEVADTLPPDHRLEGCAVLGGLGTMVPHGATHSRGWGAGFLLAAAVWAK
jgi:hypothetical protein